MLINFYLGLLGSIKDTIIGKEQLFEYLFDKVGIKGRQRFVNKYCLQHFPQYQNQMTEMMQDLYKIEQKTSVYEKVISDFRDGKLGKYTIDDISSYVL